MTSLKHVEFLADASKGHVIKTNIDSLAGYISKCHFSITPKGMFIRDADQNNVIMFDISLNREKFRSFKCKKPIEFSVHMKQFQILVKTVKKKDSLVLYIEKDKPDKLWVEIKPEGPKKTERVETNFICIQRKIDRQPLGLPDGGYEY